MNNDLDDMSQEELLALKKRVEKALETLEARRKLQAMRAAEEAARQFGFNLSDFSDLPGKPAKGTRSKGVPKFADPEDPSRTWTGKGRPPKWFEDAKARGLSEDDMRIAAA